jgi:flagellin-like protein
MDMKKIIKNKKAVSEIVGTIMLLGMAVALFTIVHLMAVNYPFNEPRPSVRLSATIDNDTVIVVHQGGESLPLDTKLMFALKNETFEDDIITNASDKLDSYTSNGDKYWGIGEKLLYNTSVDYPSLYLSNFQVRITVIDVDTNSVIMQGTVRGDSST